MPMTGATRPEKANSSASAAAASLERHLAVHFAESGPTINARVLVFALLDSHMRKHVLGTLIAYLFKALLSVVSPLAAYALLSWFKDSEADIGLGCLYAGLNTAANLGQHLVHKAYTLRGARAGQRSQVAVAGILYRRTLCLNAAIAMQYQMGELVNLLSSDCGNIADLWTGAILLVLQPLEIVAVVGILWLVVAEATLVSLGFCLLSYVGMQFFGQLVARFKFSQSKLVDERLKLLGEILYGIKVVKANGWVPRFETRIFRISEQESTFSLRRKRSMGQIVYLSAEIIDMMAFAVCTVSVLVCHQEPDASKLFTIWIFIGVLHAKLFACPEAVRKVSSAWTSLKRCSSFFEGSKAGCWKLPYATKSEGIGFSIHNGSFGFVDHGNAQLSGSMEDKHPVSDTMMKTVLADVNLAFERSRFYAVVGRVGCGKTSLLLALLGEMQMSKETEFGHMFSCLKIAYVPQDPVIFNDTVRENICFGVPLDLEKYEKVCSSSALDHDVSLFPDGDASVIGSRGINISGGQQARICLARSLYSEADVHLLDDPLAKLDARVSAEVLSNAILGLLREKTRIMVTNNVNVVRVADSLIRVEAGTVLLDCHVDASEVDLTASKNSTDDGTLGISQAHFDDEEDEQLPASLCIADYGCSPKRNNVYDNVCFFWRHFSAGLSSPWHATVYLLVELTEICLVEAGLYVLACWSDDPRQEHHSHSWYARMYACSAVTEVIMVQFKLLALAKFTQQSVDRLHKSLLVCVLRSSLSWLQGVPVGHVLQLFSATLARIDDRVFHVSELWALNFLYLIVICLMCCVIFPPFTFVLFIIGIVCCILFRRFLNADGCTQASESSLRRLLVHQYTETLTGLTLVRNFPGASGRFLKTFEDLLQGHAAARRSSTVADASSLLIFSLIGAFAYACAGWSLVLSHKLEYMSPGQAGFMMANCVFLSFLCVEAVFNTLVLLEVAEERETIYALLQTVPQELPDYTASHANGLMLGWPSHGVLSFENLEVRYKPELPSVIREFNLEVQGGEHLGIVGRTGSGKSSLLLAICRLVEPSGGRIIIDNIDISCIGLQELRPHLGILSQDPLFFGGSLRENLDPFSEHCDTYLWQMLDDVGLRELFSGADSSNSNSGLSTLITELGGNFSVGQRQLLCLARAALRTPRVVLVDEATAALDREADARVQTVLEERFSGKGATMLQVAHRLWSVAASSRVAVLENGLLVALGTPWQLLASATTGSPIFRDMVAALGEQEAARFHARSAAAAGVESATVSSI